MRILGIDPSNSATGIYSTFTGRAETIRTGGARGGARLDLIERRVSAVLQAERPQVVVLEGYAFGATNSREMAGEVGGIVRLALFRAGLWDALRIVPPNCLKKFATGNWNAKKNEIIEAVLKNWGRWLRDDNQADAFILAKIGEYLIQNPVTWDVNREQFDVLRSVLENPLCEEQRTIDARKKQAG